MISRNRSPPKNDCLLIQLGKVRIEIKYSDIENLSINFQEASNVF